MNNAYAGTDGTPEALLEGFRPAIVVSLIAAAAGVVVTAVGIRKRGVDVVEDDGDPALEVEPEAQAA